ncbi:MAG: dihydrolipoamide succinyltransferase, partial [Rhodothermales bacterium]|nr:dihydrolipoamide succinyltransferase [Rhodothermales bacterium]
GLIVPVVKRADRLSLMEASETLNGLVEAARQNRLTREDVQGGTFTITNHGVSGSLLATPVINQPQAAILGIGKTEKRVVVDDTDGFDSIQVRPMAYVTLTIDHRILDGFQANQFLADFVSEIENWK